MFHLKLIILNGTVAVFASVCFFLYHLCTSAHLKMTHLTFMTIFSFLLP